MMNRGRSHSDPTSPPLSTYYHLPSQSPRQVGHLPHLASETSDSSLQSALSGLTLTGPSRPSYIRLNNGRSETPSATSVSDDEEEAPVELNAELERWVSSGKGKAKATQSSSDLSEKEGPAGKLPPEVLIHILRLLHKPQDLYSALQVSRLWCLSGFPLLWNRPQLTNTHQLAKLTRVLRSPSTSLPYAANVRRLNLGAISDRLTDYLLYGLEECHRADRLTLTGSKNLSIQALKCLVEGLTEVTAIDLAGTSNVEDVVVEAMADNCRRLQGLNLTGCLSVGDEGLKSIATSRRSFRRLKIGQCHRVTDASMVPFAQNCPLVIELDFTNVPQLTNATFYAVFTHSAHLRELRLAHNGNIDDNGIPNLEDLVAEGEGEAAEELPWYAQVGGKRIIPAFTTMDSLRVVDLMACSALTDKAVDNLVTNAPRIRHLTLAKCPQLTDKALISVSRLGKHLHHLHLGHTHHITDEGVIQLVRSCNRIRYLDLACCENLTNLAVIEIAENLHKMRRIGLVKVKKITDDAIYALVERHTTLERIHLSYCENLTVKAITFLLNRLLLLTHLSLTSIDAFKTPELQQFCRPAPSDYGQAQRESFCVYSGHGITALRNYLNAQAISAATTTSDDDSRRNSNSSQSSLTPPGAWTAPHQGIPSSVSPWGAFSSQPIAHPPYTVQFWTGAGSLYPRNTFLNPPGPDNSAISTASSSRRDSREHSRTTDGPVPGPIFRFTSRPATPAVVPGLPESILAASAPNFLAPEPTAPNPRPRRGSREEGAAGAPPRLPRRVGPISTPGARGESASGSGIRSAQATLVNARQLTNTSRSSRVRMEARGRGGRSAPVEADSDRSGALGWMASRLGWERKNSDNGRE